MHRSTPGIRPGVTVTRTTGAWEDLASSIGRPPPRREAARWGSRAAIATVVLGLVVSEAIGIGIALAAGGGAMVAASLVVADLVLLAIVVAVASRGAERLGPATFGIRRTAFGPALGWGLALLVLNFAFSAALALLFGSAGSGHHGRLHAHHLAAGTAILVTLGVAVTAPL